MPAGTGNRVFRELLGPPDVAHALRVALEGTRSIPLDAVRYAARDDSTDAGIVLQAAGFGFPAEVTALYASLRRRPFLGALLRPLGDSVYSLLGLTRMFGARARAAGNRVTIELDGATDTVPCLAGFVANLRTVGGGFVPAPAARPDDGKFHVCLFRSECNVSLVRLAAAVRRGAHVARPDWVHVVSGARLRVRFDTPLPFMVDGEALAPCSDAEFRVLPAAADLLAS